MLVKSSHFGSATAFSRNCILALAVGILFGFCSAYVLLNIADWSTLNMFTCDRCNGSARDSLDGFNENKRQIQVSNEQQIKQFDIVQSPLAKELAQNVRVLCWILTRPTNHKLRCKSVKETWGKRCNILLFMSSKADDELPAIDLDVEEGRLFLWAKTKKAFAYVHEHYLDEADWFMKADDDTYVVVDNLRYMLQSHNPNEPIFFGRKFKHKEAPHGYMSGGSGYVLSREALKRFVEEGLPDPEKCTSGDMVDEDLEIGSCLGNVGVVSGNSKDCLGRGRFFPLELEAHLIPTGMKEDHWYWKYANTSSFERETDCCSDTAIAFHYVGPETMVIFDYFIHYFRPYGITTQLIKTNASHLYC